MISINSILSNRDSASADVCRFSFADSNTEDFIIAVNPAEFSYSVRAADGKVLEEYRRLEDSVRSEFFPVFLTLEKTLNAARNYSGDYIFNHMKSSGTTLDFKDGILSAVNVFRCEDEEYSAAAIWNLQEEIPDFTYAVFKGDELIEEYKSLYRAIDSYYYPVFAELYNELYREENRIKEEE